MNHLLIYAHPNPNSFNHAIVQTIAEEFRKAGKDILLRDLYALHFNPVLAADDFTAQLLVACFAVRLIKDTKAGVFQLVQPKQSLAGQVLMQYSTSVAFQAR